MKETRGRKSKERTSEKSGGNFTFEQIAKVKEIASSFVGALKTVDMLYHDSDNPDENFKKSHPFEQEIEIEDTNQIYIDSLLLHHLPEKPTGISLNKDLMAKDNTYKLFDMLINAHRNPHYFDYGLFQRIENNELNIPVKLKYIGKEAVVKGVP